ncbi:uncharacterized protein LOC143863993 isoform X3 [Tasmannia lanceolata]|uniref:uncharacterized protein LOC143863993 isoform X3 n=1 Tax=Tasmannia lanceolata TaxID=3420 RepID=UPI004064AD21
MAKRKNIPTSHDSQPPSMRRHIHPPAQRMEPHAPCMAVETLPSYMEDETLPPSEWQEPITHSEIQETSPHLDAHELIPPSQDLHMSSHFIPSLKRTRGATHCKDTWGSKEKKIVKFNELGQPECPKACKLANFLGSVARMGDKLPLTYLDWRKMPKQNKDDAWDIVMEKWAFGDSHKGWVIANIGRKWREWRCTLKTKYFDEDLPPPLDRITESHYRFLCDHWSTRASKDLCIQNKANRALQMIKHTGGTKSNAVYWKEETVKNGRSQSRGDIFIRTHQKKDKTPYDDTCEAIIAQIKDIQTQHPKSRSSIASDDDLGRVFGAEKRGRVRMLGPGPTPSRLFGSPSGGGMWQEKAASLERANEQLNDEVTRMSARQSEMERQIATLLSHFQGVESSNHLTILLLCTSMYPPLAAREMRFWLH